MLIMYFINMSIEQKEWHNMTDAERQEKRETARVLGRATVQTRDAKLDAHKNMTNAARRLSTAEKGLQHNPPKGSRDDCDAKKRELDSLRSAHDDATMAFNDATMALNEFRRKYPFVYDV